MENEDQCLDDQIKFTKTDGEVKVEIEALTEAAPERIVYVSCNPATLARDLKLITAHKYSVSEVQPLDLFPQTTHVECCNRSSVLENFWPIIFHRTIVLV